MGHLASFVVLIEIIQLRLLVLIYIARRRIERQSFS